LDLYLVSSEEIFQAHQQPERLFSWMAMMVTKN